MRVGEIKAALESMGKKPAKRLGQHFLVDESVLRRQVDLAELSEDDTVLEIGPGLGSLTDLLLRTGAKVVAVERDPAFCMFLARRFGRRIQLVHADAVKAFLPEFNKVVSNLPYQISSPVTFKLLDLDFETAVLMLQREFAQRMVAEPGTSAYGRLSVGVRFRADCEIMMDVPRSAFWPQPEVDSCVVRMRPRLPPFKVRDEEVFGEVTRAIFCHRRKKVANSLRSDPRTRDMLSPDMLNRLEELPHAEKRAEELTPEMIGELSNAVAEFSHAARRRSG